LPDTRTDRELVDAIIGVVGLDRHVSTEACNEFYKRFKRLLYYIPMKLYRFSREDTDDVVHEVFVKLMEGLYTWEGSENLKAFVATVTVRVCLDKKRSIIKRRLEDQIDPDEGDEPPTGESDPEAIAELNEQRAIIQAEIKEFPLKNRLVFGYWLMSYSYREIQWALRFNHKIESSVNEVGVIVNRCRKRLKTAIRKKGLA